MEIRILDDHEAASRAAADLFVETSHRALERSGRFTVALAGGSTPKLAYELLASDPRWRAVPWDRTHVFFGDERMVEPDSELSNYRMASEILLDRVPLPKANIHRMRGELEPESAVSACEAELRSVFGPGVPEFDLVLLGMGADGHTASIFPGTRAVAESCLVTSVRPADVTPDVNRLTFCLPLLNNAARVVFLATGADKAQVLAKMRGTDTARHLFPAAMVNARETLLLTDQPI